MIITATSIVGRKISWNPEVFMCTIQDKTKDKPDETPSKVLSVFNHYNVKEMNITNEESDRILSILESMGTPTQTPDEES